MGEFSQTPSNATSNGKPLDDAAAVLDRVQRAFRAVVDDIPGPTSRPVQLEQALGLHKTLAWKLAKIVAEGNPVAAFPRIPGGAAVEQILGAAGRVGVTPNRLDEVRGALSQLEEVIASHAGDRETFELMLAGVSHERREEEALQIRKDGFRATSHIWGVQANAIARAVIVHPTAAPGPLLDAAVVFGCADFRRLRADRPWVLNRWRPTDDEGVPVPIEREPIDPDSRGRAPLLTAYSSVGHEGVRRATSGDGMTEDELLDGPIGNAGAATCFFGEVLRAVMSRHSAEAHVGIAQNLELRTPCRAVIFDHLVRKDLFGRVDPQVRVFGELAGRPLYSTLRSNRDQLDVFERVEFLGTGPEAFPVEDIPDYDSILTDSCARLGWDPDDFHVYRLRMLYPYVPATITYGYPLPA